MSEKNPYLAPLTREMLTAAASKQTGLTANTQTVRQCVDFALWALQEADRLADPWKRRQECEKDGHDFVMPEDDAPEGTYDGVEGMYVLKEYVAPRSECRNCDAVLVIEFKEKI